MLFSRRNLRSCNPSTLTKKKHFQSQPRRKSFTTKYDVTDVFVIPGNRLFTSTEGINQKTRDSCGCWHTKKKTGKSVYLLFVRCDKTLTHIQHWQRRIHIRFHNAENTTMKTKRRKRMLKRQGLRLNKNHFRFYWFSFLRREFDYILFRQEYLERFYGRLPEKKKSKKCVVRVKGKKNEKKSKPRAMKEKRQENSS